MNVQITEAIWLDDQGVCQIEQLAELSGLSPEEIADLVEVGVLEPVDRQAQPLSFTLRHIVTVKTAKRLREDFQLDRSGLAVALTLLRRIHALEAEIRMLRG